MQNWSLGCFGIGFLLGLSSLEGVVRYGGMVSNGDCFQSFGGLPAQVGRVSFDPKRFVPDQSWQPLPTGEDCNPLCIMGLRVTLGQRCRGLLFQSTCSGPVALGLLAPWSWKPQGQYIVPQGFKCVTYLSSCLPPAHV